MTLGQETRWPLSGKALARNFISEGFNMGEAGADTLYIVIGLRSVK